MTDDLKQKLENQKKQIIKDVLALAADSNSLLDFEYKLMKQNPTGE